MTTQPLPTPPGRGPGGDHPTDPTDHAAREPRLRPSGRYRQLRSFQVATLSYDATVDFCERFLDKRSRTVDQMVQAARSGGQNIAEGSRASATSSQTELRLVNVARASLDELLPDRGPPTDRSDPCGWAYYSRGAVGGRITGVWTTGPLFRLICDRKDLADEPHGSSCHPCLARFTGWRAAVGGRHTVSATGGVERCRVPLVAGEDESVGRVLGRVC